MTEQAPGFIAITIALGKLGSSGQRYNVFHDGQMIVEGTKDPFFNGARAIVALGGADLDDTLVQMGLDGRPSLSSRLGWAAAHSVSEGQSNGPRVVKWSPHPGAFDEDGEVK